MNADDRLVFWGVLLFFLSLLTGVLLVASPPFVANPRGVLAGHLEAAMNGMFVMIVGLFFTASDCRRRKPASVEVRCSIALSPTGSSRHSLASLERAKQQRSQERVTAPLRVPNRPSSPASSPWRSQ
jgi:hypothetical protein